MRGTLGFVKGVQSPRQCSPSPPQTCAKTVYLRLTLTESPLDMCFWLRRHLLPQLESRCMWVGYHCGVLVSLSVESRPHLGVTESTFLPHSLPQNCRLDGHGLRLLRSDIKHNC